MICLVILTGRCAGVQVDPGATPGWAPGETPAVGATPAGKRGRSRWDETPVGVGMGGGATPMMGQTPMMGMTLAMTPMGGMDMPTPSPSSLPKVPLTAEQYQVCSLPSSSADTLCPARSIQYCHLCSVACHRESMHVCRHRSFSSREQWH